MAVPTDKRASELTAPVSIADADVFAGYRPGTGGEPNLDIRATAGQFRAPILAGLATGGVPVAASGVQIAANALGAGSVSQALVAKLKQRTTVVDYGAHQDGSDYDFKTVLDAIFVDALPHNQGIIDLNMGRYRLKTTWNPNDQTSGGANMLLGKLFRGLTLFGGWGKIGNPQTGGDKYYGAPEIVWYGSAGSTMFEWDTIVGSALIGIAFRGGSGASAPSANQAGIILNISQRNTGLPGSGVHLLDRCSFADFAVAVRCGEGQVTGGGNCDTTTFREATFQNGTTCLDLTHQQNLVYNFDGTSSFLSVKNIVKSSAGGYFNIDDLNANGCGGTTTNDWMFDLAGGQFVGTHKISRGRIEGNCKQLLRVNGGYCNVLIEGLTEAQSNQSVTMFDLTGGSTTIIGGQLITNDTTNPTFYLHQHSASGTAPVLHLDKVMFDQNNWTPANWFKIQDGAYPYIRMTGCYLQNGRRIPDWSNRIDSRLPVICQGNTTNGTSTVALTLLRNGVTAVSYNCVSISRGMWRIRVVIMAGVQSSGNITSIQLRVTREVDVHSDGTTVTLVNTDTIGTDYNPDSLSVTLAVNSTYKHLRADVVGKASTNLYWQANFSLIGEYSNWAL